MPHPMTDAADAASDVESPSRRPGGRTARNTAAVFEAVIEELATRRFDEVSIESIALRAGVHKSTLYRRWSTKSRLLVDALEDAAAARLEFPDTGRFAGDLEGFAFSIARMLVSREGAAVLAAYTVEAPHNAEMRAAFRRFRSVREQAVAALVSRAIDRGEIPEGTDSASLLTNLLGPLYYSVLIEVRPPAPEVVSSAVRATVASARSGAFVDRTPLGANQDLPSPSVTTSSPPPRVQAAGSAGAPDGSAASD